MTRQSFQAHIVADTLEFIDSKRVTPSLIDCAQEQGLIDPQDVVLTSMGNAHRATITPYYPAILFEHAIFDRLDWAAIQGRPFTEAVVSVYQPGESIVAANVVIRHCVLPSLEGVNHVWQAGARYPTDTNRSYGTTDSVIDEIIRQRNQGEAIESVTGIVHVPEQKLRSSRGHWAASGTLTTDELVGMRRSIIENDYTTRFI